ncbi:hypothetical protein SCUP234_12552 [Seiridium cupressi]
MSASEQGSSALLRLPAEVLVAVTSQLPNSAIKKIRLACRALRDRAALRLDRVFLSANPRNVEVLRAVADHETFRHHVVEIIWDDALLVSDIPGPSDRLQPWGAPSPTSCPGWYHRACEEIASNLRRVTRSDHPDFAKVRQVVDAQLPPDVSWECYQSLLHQQDEVLASGTDVEAFRYGLERFPALKRVTITPAAHGMLFVPLYETPMIRAFPEGFNYHIPRGWPTPERGDLPYYVRDWNDKSKWRGFSVIDRELAHAREDHHVTELVLDVHYLNTGLNCHVFDSSNEEYDNLVKIFQRPGFSRIDLALLAEGQQYQGWSSFRNGHLKSALGQATDLRRFSLQNQVVQDQFYEENDKNFVPLKTLLPVEKWHKLRHFGLLNFLVKQDDLLALLASLPTSVRSVELGFFRFLDRKSFKDLLDGMRKTLDWGSRPVNERPVVTILCVEYATKLPWRYMWAQDAVNDFLYRGAVNPFGTDGDRPDQNRGAVIRDPFLPALDRLHEYRSPTAAVAGRPPPSQ